MSTRTSDNPRRILVTGAGGFVGRQMIEFIRERDDSVVFGTLHRAPDSPSNGDSASPNTPSMFIGDLVDEQFVDSVIRDAAPDWIVHLAAQPSVAESWQKPAETLVNNVLAQLRVLDAVVRHSPGSRFLVVGSSEEYGRGASDAEIASEETPLRPRSPYATSKVAQDYLGLQYYLGRGVDVVRARPFNLFGPGQTGDFAIASFARQIVEAELGRRPPIVEVGNLAARRDYTDVRDAVRAYWALLERGRSGEVYNVGGGGVRSIGEILSSLLQRARCAVTVRTDPDRYRPTDSFSIGPDVSRIHRETGWQATIPFDQTVDDILEDWRRRLV